MCLALLGAVACVRWVLLSPAAEALTNEDVIRYRFRPPQETWAAQSEPVSAVVSSPVVASPKMEAQVAKASLSHGSSFEKASLKARPKAPKIYAASRVIQVETPKTTRYIVEPGDILGKISQKFYGTSKRYRDILKANPGLSPKALKPGMSIVIPSAPAGMEPGAVQYLQQAKPHTRPYTVKGGDVLSKIAQKELGSIKYVSNIMEVNPGLKPSRLRLGQVIQLPLVGHSSH